MYKFSSTKYITSRNFKVLYTTTTSNNSIPKLSQMLIPNVKLNNISKLTTTELLIKSGFIYQSSSGFYSILPFAKKALDNLENVIKQELDIIGCQQVDLPTVLSGNLLKQSGRWDSLGTELFRLHDRKDQSLALAPTHEEEVTQLMDNLVMSYKQLPTKVYQINKKFRDELRPRAGLLRTKEFLMKDLYSFDVDLEGSLKSYEDVAEAYKRIFAKLDIPIKKVQADSGKIGGNLSHEYHILTEAGEDTILSCSSCSYAANLELATSNPIPSTEGSIKYLQYIDVDTKAQQLVIINKSDTVNLTKLNKTTGMDLKFLMEVEAKDLTDMQVANSIIDNQVHSATNFNSQILTTTHQTQTYDVRQVQTNEPCINCSSPLQRQDGIEVGHTFHLNTKYSYPLEATFTSVENSVKPFVMGCYGLGITRILQAALHINRDEKGFKWTKAIAPYHIVVMMLDLAEATHIKFQKVMELKECSREWRWVLDDQSSLSKGNRFKRADLLGFPIQLRLSAKLAENEVEVYLRNLDKIVVVDVCKLDEEIERWLKA